jgi:hypothetical protein
MRYILILLAFGLANCQAIKPYEKEFLLDPAMDDGTTLNLESAVLIGTCQQNERLSGTVIGSKAATSCPTCGG